MSEAVVDENSLAGMKLPLLERKTNKENLYPLIINEHNVLSVSGLHAVTTPSLPAPGPNIKRILFLPHSSLLFMNLLSNQSAWM